MIMKTVVNDGARDALPVNGLVTIIAISFYL